MGGGDMMQDLILDKDAFINEPEAKSGFDVFKRPKRLTSIMTQDTRARTTKANNRNSNFKSDQLLELFEKIVANNSIYT
jgi:hypothetical protein